MPSAHSNITDFAIDNSKKTRDAANDPKIGSKFKHHRKHARGYGDRFVARVNESQRLRTTIGDAEFRRALVLKEFEKSAKKAPASATAEDDAIIADAKARLEELTKEKYPSDEYFARIEHDLPRVAKSEWKARTTTYHVGDTRPHPVIRKECRAKRIGKERKLDSIIKAPRHSEDAIASAMADLQRRAEAGKPSIARTLQGFTVSARTGEFQLNRNPEIEFPESMTKPSEFHTAVPIYDVLSMAIAKDLPGYQAWIKQLILARANDADAIRDVDRPAAIAKAKAELLEAQHAEEAANVLCELQGLMVFRPPEWPTEVLLGLERDSTAKPQAAPTPTIDEFEDDDFEDDAE